ncbi:MAG: hypothetical protein ACYTG4_08125 [Planctomycetota bacterium]
MSELSFERPVLLLVAIPLVALVLRRSAPGARHHVAGTLRALAVLLAMGAAAGPVLEGERTRPRELLVAVHGEESIRPSAPGMEREVLVHAHADGATAVAGAMAMRTPGSNARLLLITDGRGPGTEAMATALRGALQSGTPVLIRERTRSGVAAAPPAAGLAGVTLPRALAPGVPFSPRWNWDPAGADTRGWTVSTRVNGKALDAQDAAAPPRELKLGPGVHILEVDARDASGSDRGRVRLPVVIPGAARVVVVDEPNGSLTLSAALRAQGLEVESATRRSRTRRPRLALRARARGGHGGTGKSGRDSRASHPRRCRTPGARGSHGGALRGTTARLGTGTAAAGVPSAPRSP